MAPFPLSLRPVDRTRHAHRAEQRRDRAAEAAERLLVQAALRGARPLTAAVALGASERQARAAARLRGAEVLP